MKGKMLELKNYLKAKAAEIKKDRAEYKREQREKGYSYMKEDVEALSYDFRNHHIAYCEMRGRTRNQIECPKEGNEADEFWIENIKAQYKEIEEEVESNEETLRLSA